MTARFHPNDNVINVRDFGAKGDGVLSSNVWTGTDNTTALNNAFVASQNSGKPLYVPTGTYYCATSPFTTAFTSTAPVAIFGDGMDHTKFIWKDDTNPFIATTFSASTRVTSCDLHDFSVIGPWLQTQVPNAGNGIAIRLYDCDNIRITRVGVDYSTLMSIAARGAHNVWIEGCRIRWSARDGINTDASYVGVVNNHLEHIGDDSIACTSQIPSNSEDYPVRDGIVVANNRIIDGQGIVCISARGASITGNSGIRIRGRWISITNAGTGGEGATSGNAVTISGNTCRDIFSIPGTISSFTPYVFNISARPVNTGTAVGSTTAGPPGQSVSTGEFVSPFPWMNENTTDTTLPMPPSYLFNITGNTYFSSANWANSTAVVSPTLSAAYTAGTTNVTVSSVTGVSTGMTVCGQNVAQGTTVSSVAGNVITLSAGLTGPVPSGMTLTIAPATVPLYSSLGFGLAMGQNGFTDFPLYNITTRNSWGLYFSPAGSGNVVIDTVNFSNNILSGLNYGIYVASSTITLRNMLCCNNIFKAMNLYAITMATSSLSRNIIVDGNIFDGDPYFENTAAVSRTITGTTSDGNPLFDGSFTSSSQRFIFQTPVGGMVVRNNTIRNWNGLWFSQPTNVVFENNVLVCQPSVVGQNVSNKGIGQVVNVPGFRYRIENSDPTSGTYGQLLNDCPIQATAMPNSGTFVIGHYTQNVSPSVSSGKILLGWQRLTTGSSHVSGTDWSPVYAPTSNTVDVEAITIFTTTGNYTATATDNVIIIKKTTGAATTVTLPSSPSTGRAITIKDGAGNASSFNITITPATGTIDGAANIVLNQNYSSVDLIYNGSEWSVL